MYDLLMRVPLTAWVLITSLPLLSDFIQHLHSTTTTPLHIAARLSSILFLWLIATMVIFRTPPANKADGWEPRISALAGTFLMYGVAFFPHCELSSVAEIVATLFTTIGSIAAIIALYRLGRSFSIMAESRRLVVTGPYRFVRHPLYLAEMIALAGLFMQYASIWTALLFSVQIAFQLRRMHNEEAVLSRTFPEYAIYQQHTARLIPGIY